MYQAYSESGQTPTEFARERGTSYWKVKSAIRKTESESASPFQEVSVGGAIAGAEYRVTLRNGRELNVPAHFSEKRVRQLIGILESC
jgi:hypothetical protein